MKTVLLTGFEPFGGETLNPSWEAVKQLAGWQTHGAVVHTLQLPCIFGVSRQLLEEQMRLLQPDVVIAVGQAGRPDITLERIAINVDDARIPDNAGYQPVDVPVIAGGAAAFFTTLPIKATLRAMREAGVPASVSQTAGTFVCNHIMYAILHAQAQGEKITKGGFIHVPWMPEQAVNHPGAASMAVETVVKGLKVAVQVALTVHEDESIGAGATH